MSKVLTYEPTNLGSYEDYMNELQSLHQELGIAIETDTLIKDDLKMLKRIDEIMVILAFLKGENRKKTVSKITKSIGAVSVPKNTDEI